MGRSYEHRGAYGVEPICKVLPIAPSIYLLDVFYGRRPNPPAPFEKGRFPKITLFDNVVLQHKLVTERLGLQSLRLVTGWSMGACQTYQWAAQFPDMVQAAAPIAGSARTASFNKVFLLSLRRALELDPAYHDGFYDRNYPRGSIALVWA